MNGGSSDIHTLSRTEQTAGEKLLRTQGAQPGTLWWPRGWDGGRSGRLKRGGVCIIKAELCPCTAETNTTL